MSEPPSAVERPFSVGVRAHRQDPTPSGSLLKAQPPHAPTTISENFRIVFPLFFVGVAGFVLSLFLFQAAGAVHPSRVPLWLLSVSIGIVATAGASTALVFGDFAPTEANLAEAAIESGEYVLVPRTEWEGLRSKPETGTASESPADWSDSALAPAGPTEVSSPSQEGAPKPAVSSGAGVPEGALWEESIFPNAVVRRAGQVSRATDRLAEQVDELVRELDVTIEPPTPAVAPPVGAKRKTTARSATAPRSPARAALADARAKAAAEAAADAAATEEARQEYESLIHELKDDAERAAVGESRLHDLVCNSCARSMAVDEAWEACTGCWRTYCPDCLITIHPTGRAFVCPKCGHRK